MKKILTIIIYLSLSPIIYAQELVKNIDVSPYGSHPTKLTAIDGMVYFSANNGRDGYELWVSNGTMEGTYMLFDINNLTGRSSDLSNFVKAGENIFFTANDGTNGTELWKTNGTSAGTSMVKNINREGINGSDPYGLFAVGNEVYFSAYTPDAGNELWKSDGTSGGTILVKNIGGGNISSNPRNFTLLNGQLFFTTLTD